MGFRAQRFREGHYLDEELLRAAKVVAARTDRREYEIAGRFGNAHLTNLVGPSPPVLDPRAFLDLLESG